MAYKKITVLGGDMRIRTLANCLYLDGYDVAVYGYNENIEFQYGIEKCSSLADALANADIVVCGLPVTKDEVTVNSPLWNGEMKIIDMVKNMKKGSILLGGKITDKMKNLCVIYNVETIDYFDREELTVSNAVPTAEGAIEIAMRELPITVHGSHSLVMGFGRIGKVLAKDLAALGSKTYVEARRFSDLSWIEAYGYKSIYLPQLKEQLPVFDVIYNTVPFEILTEDLMRYVKKDCLIIDLASAPGGIDKTLAKKHGINVIHALSLPGKVAPKTSGEIIEKAILNILTDRGSEK